MSTSIIQLVRGTITARFVLALLLFGLPANPEAQPQNFWQQTNGPNGGSVQAFAINSSGDIFAGTFGGGVFRSADNGATWTATNSGLTDPFILALAINQNGNIFAGTDGGGILRSVDNGSTWSQASTGLANLVVQAFAINASGHLFAGTAGGAFRSTNNGGSWTEINNGLANKNVRALVINSSGHIFAGTVGGVFRSTNNGDNWTQVNNGLSNTDAYALAINASGQIFAGTNGGVFRSPNNGDNWTPKNIGLTNNNIRSIAINASGHIFVGTEGGGIFRSLDNGENWASVNAGLTNKDVRALAINSNGHIFAGTFNGGSFRSLDNGANWSNVNTGLGSTRVLSFAINSNGHIFAGTFSGIFRSTDNGSNWTPMNAGLTNSEVRALAINSTGQIFAGTNGGGVFRSPDNGANWTAANSGLTNRGVLAFAINSSGQIFAGTSGGVFRSNDNGGNWTAANNGLTNATVLSFAINASGHLFAGTNGGVFRSTDNGDTWTAINNGLTNLVVQALAINANGHIFAGTNGGGVFRSLNNGANWVQANDGLTNKAIAALAINCKGEILAGNYPAGGSGVFRSMDNADSWTLINTGLTNTYVRALAVDSSGFVYAGTSGAGVFRSAAPATCAEDIFTRVTAGDIVNARGSSIGAVWGDYNNDNYLDLFVANGNDEKNFLFVNNRDGSFTRIIEGDIVNDEGCSHGSSWGDYDNDSDLDLFVTDCGQNNFLYRNDGSPSYTFTRIRSGVIIVEEGISIGCSWGDYNNDGYLDLFVANEARQGNYLYRNDGPPNFTFTKIIEGEIVKDIATSRSCSWADYDNDGDLDLFVANRKGGNNFLYRNDGPPMYTFTKIKDGEIVNDGGEALSGSWGDYDNDGDLDLFVAKGAQRNFLYANNGNGTFRRIVTGDIAIDVGASHSSNWGDFDNDGDLDLFVANDLLEQNNFLYSNSGPPDYRLMRFRTSVVATDADSSWSCSWADFDNDGDLDLFVANVANVNNRSSFLYRNNGNNNRWINIKCIGTRANVSAIGAKVKIKTTIKGLAIWQMNEISGQTGWNGQNSLNAEFGLGNAAIIDSIKIEWPSGARQILTNVNARQLLTIRENRAPRVANAIPNQTLQVGGPSFSRNLNASPAVFVDDDGDTLNYTTSSSAANIATVSLSRSTLTVAPVAGGIAMIFVTANDGRGGSASDTFKITVNRSPIVSNLIGNQMLTVGGSSFTRNLNASPVIFSDPDGDTLAYTANSSATNVATANIARSTITVAPVAVGSATITVTANDGRGGTAPATFAVTVNCPPYPATLKLTTTINYPTLANARDYKDADYQIVGLPGASNRLASEFLAGKQNSDWQVFRDNGAVSDFFKAFDGSTSFQFSVGRAFWIINKGNVIINAPAPSAPLNAAQELELPLQSGWNMIANPFTASVAWSKIQLANNVTEPIWAFNNSFAQSANFDPYIGYYFFNATNLPSLKIAYSLYCSASLASREANAGWRIHLVLSSGQSTDGTTTFGVFREARVDLDAFDFRKPRALASMPTVEFKRPKWDASYSIFAADIRPEFEGAESWEFDVRAISRQPAQLTFAGISKIPRRFEIYLLDEGRAQSANLREDSLYRFTPAAELMKFKVVVGRKEKVQEQLNSLALPKEFALGPNYPNPFNRSTERSRRSPTTTIPISVPVAAEIKLKIYNLLSAEVKTIYDGTTEAGRYWFNWDGRNELGNQVATGVYLYRLTTSKGASLLGKMILVR